jgi:hypothetical protein
MWLSIFVETINTFAEVRLARDCVSAIHRFGLVPGHCIATRSGMSLRTNSGAPPLPRGMRVFFAGRATAPVETFYVMQSEVL